ncbi:MAG: ornithine carbamoyltransferase [Chthonomonadaceae bacterium]|nr:ornithine carbamoyltransferase [Chthonomonadaceae bacterium]
MWQRFTERARRVVFFAQEEAGRLGENYVSTEHLLLGLVRENDSVAARILDSMGVSLGRIRNEIERQVARGDGRLGQDMQLTPRAKRVIDLAYDEARQLRNNYIGTEHLLLGLIREGEGLAGRVLAKLGVELERCRLEVTGLQDSDSASKTSISFSSRMREDEPPSSASSRGHSGEQALKALIQRDESHWRGRSLVSLFDVSPAQVQAVLECAASFKALKREDKFLYFSHPKTLALLFEKPSLRTRVSFEAGMAHLAGHAVYLAPADVGLGVRESVADVAGGLSRWVDVIAARTFKHETVEELATSAKVPVINALSDREHPIQAFADLQTIMEAKGSLGNHLKLAYVGDGNNVLHALLLACAKVGVNVTAACPEGYEPALAYVAEAQRIGAGEAGTGARIEIVTDPVAAVTDADVVYTDVWTSMGQEEETKQRLQIFAPYQVNAALLAHAKSDVIVLHCLPAHREEEITTDVMDAHKTIILDQAENRLHTQKALVALMVGL